MSLARAFAGLLFALFFMTSFIRPAAAAAAIKISPATAGVVETATHHCPLGGKCLLISNQDIINSLITQLVAGPFKASVEAAVPRYRFDIPGAASLADSLKIERTCRPDDSWHKEIRRKKMLEVHIKLRPVEECIELFCKIILTTPLFSAVYTHQCLFHTTTKAWCTEKRCVREFTLYTPPTARIYVPQTSRSHRHGQQPTRGSAATAASPEAYALSVEAKSPSLHAFSDDEDDSKTEAEMGTAAKPSKYLIDPATAADAQVEAIFGALE